MTGRCTTAVIAVLLGLVPSVAHGAGGAKHAHAPEGGWSFEGIFGRFDMAQLQRGYKVYREVCAACHGAELVTFRNLGQTGGPFFDPEFTAVDNPVVRQIASEFLVADIDGETGDIIERPATPADSFVSPFPNDSAAAASNGGALPPDLSVITKARKGGASYIYSLLAGYPDSGKMETTYAGLDVPAGQYFNPYFSGDVLSIWSGDPRKVPAGGVLAMSPPLVEDIVEYDDGTPATVETMAADVSAFLQWVSDPKQTARKRLGFAAMLYLFALTILVYMAYRSLWRHVAH